MTTHIFFFDEDAVEETPQGCCDICGMPFEECPAEKMLQYLLECPAEEEMLHT